jgi:APA family basic amino acid/polyamine antiporter
VNRQIPSWIGQLGRRYEVPYKAIILCALAVFGLAMIGDVEVLAGIYAFGATLAITLAHLSVLRLRTSMPDTERPFRAPLNLRIGGTEQPLTAVAGAILSSLALISVLVFHDSARWVGLGWLAVGLLGYVIYRKVVEQVSLTKQVSVDAKALTRPRVSIDFHNILVPIFGTRLDDDIVSTAGRMAAEGDPDEGDARSVMTILYLIEIPLARAIKDPLPEEVADEAQRATKRAKEIADEYEDVEIKVEIARVRKKGTGIVVNARRLGVDAIVMGAEPPSTIRGGAQFGGIGDYRPDEIGPITAYVLKRAPCRVLLTAPGE